MPIRYPTTVIVEDDLQYAVSAALKNPRNNFDIQGVITISKNLSNEMNQKGKTPIVSLYVTSKYAEFYGEFVKTAKIDSDLEQLMKYIDQNKWKTNLEQK